MDPTTMTIVLVVAAVAIGVLSAIRSSGNEPGQIAGPVPARHEHEAKRPNRGGGRSSGPAPDRPAWLEELGALDDAGRLRLMLQHFEPVIAARAEKLAVERDSNRASLTGSLDGRHLRVHLASNGSASLEVDADTGDFDLALYWGTPKEDRERARRDLGKGVYLQVPHDELQDRIAQWETLSASNAGARILSKMRTSQVSVLSIGGGRIELEPLRRLTQRSVVQPEKELDGLLELVATATRAVVAHGERKAWDDAKEEEEAPAAASGAGAPVSERTAHGERLRGYDDHDSHAERDEAISPVFEELAQELENPEIILPTEHEDDYAELRGQRGELQLSLSVTDHGAWAVSCHTQSPHCVHLAYAPDKSPKPPEARGRPDDPIRVFVAPGVYIEGDEREVDLYTAFCATLPAGLLDELAERFVRIPLSFVSHNTVGELVVEAGEGVAHLDDPLTSFREVLGTCVDVGQALGAGEPRSLSRTTCKYCRATFFFGPHREACPNCGAPAEAPT